MRLVYYSLILLTCFSCSKSSKDYSSLLDFVPKRTTLIIKTNNIESLNSSVNNNSFIQNISKTKTYKQLKQKLQPLSHLTPSSSALICFSNDKNDSLQYSVITKMAYNIFVTDSLPNYKEEILTYKDKTITKSTINDATFYSTIIGNTFFASSSKTLVDGVFNEVNVDEELKKAYRSLSDNRTVSVITTPNYNSINSMFIEDSLTINQFSKYTAVDVELNQNETYFNGITKANDSNNSFINTFKNTKPQINQIQNITPSNSDGFMSFTFDNFDTFKTNLQNFNKKDSTSYTSSLFNDVFEVGVIYEDENRAIVLNSSDIISTNDALISEQSIANTYREINIYNFSTPHLFAETFSPLISHKKASLYCILDHFFVFTDNTELLENIIVNYQNKTTLHTKNHFKSVKEKLSEASSLLQVANGSILKTILNKSIKSDTNYSISDYNTAAFQYIYDTNFAHINGIVKKNKANTSSNSISEEFNIKFENDLLNPPQLVENHITKQKEIVIQDVKNNLYLISNKGKILWKKQLQGPVLGKIEQIDIYKNGRLQLAFATPNRLYVLARNGKEVKPFSLKFKDKITQPLAVFDYDNNKKYRLLVTQGKNVLMYDVKGKTVKGFKFKSASNEIISQPKHFRIGTKDYITLKTNNKLYILDRLGKTRVKPKQDYTYSNQPIFLYNNTFTTTTATGGLVSIDTKGNTVSKNLSLSKNHDIVTSSKTLVAQSENQLTIKSNRTELDFGNYSNPKLFFINNKIYVSTTDIQAHKVYLFDSQSKQLPNFPVYGNSSIELDNIDKDSNLEFVAKGENNSIILYEINN